MVNAADWIRAARAIMADLRIYRAFLAVPMPYRAKAFALAALAAGLPLIALAGASAGHKSPIGWALAASVLALAALVELLAPVGVAARRLEQCLHGEKAGAQARGGDEAARLLADVAQLGAELDGLRDRARSRHPITGLSTRDAFLASLALDQREAGRLGVLGVVRFADYERLAAFDQDGADKILAAFALRLNGAISRNRPLGQVDRDCFGLWFDDVDNPLAAAAELLALVYVLDQDLACGETKIRPEVTVGVAVFPNDARDPTSLLTRAYAALPKPEQLGAPKVALFCSETASAARDRFALEQGLRHAIARDELFLHFQPVVDMATPRVIGAEALLRWRHPDRGLVSPAEFIPVIEASGMMEEFGLWVLDAACTEARAWQQAGLTGMKMAVNLSARQLHQGPLLRMVMRTLERHGLEPEALELELTESAAMVDDEGTRTLLADLRALGVSVAIDDFGTGYSSLSNLRRLPFSRLKIDREFVTGVDANRDNHAICSALVELARGLEISILAEGAETLEEVETLRGLGCSMFQGFFFSRPLAAADFARTVVDPDWLALLASPVHRKIASLGRRVA
jgi:EAL domain-containing protein (putative c-di-GMP-specific phosphodiesterase class I)/GGDEF domain-containing protein